MGVKIEVKKPLKGHTVIVGFPGIGLVGPIAAKHIVDSMGMELIGAAFSESFPTVAAIKNGVSLPPVRIYADGEKKIAVVLSEILFSDKTAKALGETLVETAKNEGAKRILSIAGVLVPTASSRVLWGAGSTKEEVEFLKGYGIQPVEKGITTGISAALLVKGQETGVPVALILGALRTKEDYRTAAEIVKKLDEMLGLDVSYGELTERAKNIEKEVCNIFARSKQRDSPMYG